MATADKLLERIFCWIEEKERFADNLKKLAKELESLREKCNVRECVGSSVTVLGAAGMIGAGVATFFTFGLGAPLFGLATQITQIGSDITNVSKSIEKLHNSKTMKKVEIIEKKSNKIAEEIQQLFQKLKSEQKEANPLLKPDELAHHIMAEFLRAIARHSGLNVQINDSMLNEMLQESPLEKISGVHSRGACGGSSSAGTRQRSEEQFGDWTSISDTKSSPQMIETCLEKTKMLVNPLLPSGVLFLSAVLIFIDHKGKAKLSDAVLQLLGSTGFLAGVMVVGGLNVMTCALPEMIDNWTKMIKGNHVTETSQSLRDTAYGIQETTQKLKEQIKKIKKNLEIEQELQKTEEEQQKSEETEEKLLKLLVIVLVQQMLQEIEEEESSEEEDLPAVNVGLLNVRSIKDMMEKRLKIKKLITENNLDVFLLTETWLENDTADEALRETVPPNFKFHQQSREGRGGGVAILVSKKLNSQRIHFNLGPTTFEYVATALGHDEWNKDVLFINVYRPPTNTIPELEDFIGEFDALLEKAKGYNRIIVAGDFNIHFEDPSNEKKRRLKLPVCLPLFSM